MLGKGLCAAAAAAAAAGLNRSGAPGFQVENAQASKSSLLCCTCG
jgi:hypothetical protein